MALDDVFGDAVGTIREHYATQAERKDVQNVILLMEAMDAVLMGEFPRSGPKPVDEQWYSHHRALRSAIEQLDVTTVSMALDQLQKRVEELRGEPEK
jgi:hypothetical protein